MAPLPATVPFQLNKVRPLGGSFQKSHEEPPFLPKDRVSADQVVSVPPRRAAPQGQAHLDHQGLDEESPLVQRQGPVGLRRQTAKVLRSRPAWLRWLQVTPPVSSNLSVPRGAGRARRRNTAGRREHPSGPDT